MIGRLNAPYGRQHATDDRSKLSTRRIVLGQEVEECAESSLPTRASELALPHDQDAKALASQQPYSFKVSRFVRPKLYQPVPSIGLWLCRPWATLMRVPEAAVHEHRPSLRPVGQVWRTR